MVVDASAVVDVLLGGAHRRWLLDQLSVGDLLAPAHQPAEVLSALGRLERSGRLGAAEAASALASAASLPQRLVIPDRQLLLRAFELRERLRVLDGLYVALAEKVGAPLLTTDGRLVRSEPPCEVLTPAP